ncbi:MAG TPA: hypothetical protein DHU89_04940 [Flavobacteriales bacterium]|nr:hypothetical protein [Flavobacteriales bacterium]
MNAKDSVDALLSNVLKLIPHTSSTIIKVSYDSNRVGTFSKNMPIFSNAVNEPEKLVTIKGMIVG